MEEKKTIKKQVNRISLGLFIYNIILYLVVIIDLIIKCIQVVMKYQTESVQDQKLEQLTDSLASSGSSSIVGVLAGLLFLLLFFRNNKQCRQVFQFNRKLAFTDFWPILLVFLSSQFVFSLFSSGVEYVLNLLGYSLMGEIETATSQSTTISMFLYASFIAPIAEELTYRGFVLRGLERYGKMFSIVVSSLLFGAMHANFLQGIFAFFVGLVLAYVALEYSIYWSIFLHILNNCILNNLWSYAISGFSDTVQMLLQWGLLSVFFVGGCLVLWKKRQFIHKYLQDNRVGNKYYIYAFTSVWMILFLIMCFLIGFSGIEKIG